MGKDQLRPFLHGGSGTDFLIGTSGQDQITGGTGIDVALMSGGIDTFDWLPGDGSDIVEGGPARTFCTCPARWPTNASW